jgi:hypothetical protein
MAFRFPLALLSLVLFIVGARAGATPRLALLSGTRCSACHFTPHGGGIRTELGWGAMNEVGAWRWPWQPKKALGTGDDAGEDLFGAPSTTPPSDGEAAPDTTGAPENDVPGGGAPDEATSDTAGQSSSDATAAPAETELAATGEEETAPTNALLDGLITPGVDMRFQVAKIGRPPNDVRMFLPMQTQVNLALAPAPWIALYGGYNYAVVEHSYAGQSSWEATAQFQPGVTLPILRVGYMQPSIGIRHDDHTTFTRREVAGRATHPLVPPGYAELGAEVTYEGIHWLTLNAGIFGSKNLADVEPSIGEVTSYTDFSKPSVLGRVMLWPQDLDLGFNGELGASYFANGDFRMVNIFGGLGVADRSTILVEGLIADFPDAHRVRNVSIMGSYQLFAWLSLDWRYEWAQTEDTSANNGRGELAHAHQAVFGFEFFPLPYIEIRPEYRFYETEPFAEFGGYLQGQYAVQLHLFY